MKSRNDEKTDRLLESPGQQKVRQLMKELPEDTVSLSWRSSLNERLLKLEPVRKKVALVTVAFRALAAVGLATLLCLAVISRTGISKADQAVQSRTDGTLLASALVSEHKETENSAEIGGVGVAVADPDPTGAAAPADSSDSDGSL